jgi:hypothetical protein
MQEVPTFLHIIRSFVDSTGITRSTTCLKPSHGAFADVPLSTFSAGSRWTQKFWASVLPRYVDSAVGFGLL